MPLFRSVFVLSCTVAVALTATTSHAFTPCHHRHSRAGTAAAAAAVQTKSNPNPLFSTKEDNEESPISATQMNRRSAIETSGKALAAALLLSSATTTTMIANTLPAQAAEDAAASITLDPKTIVMTGCNSGIGFDAAKRMALKGHTVIMACRSMDKAQDAVNKIQALLPNNNNNSNSNSNLIPKECDLADLNSVQKFAADLRSDASYTSNGIDSLCLNAGIARNTSAKDVLRTKQGFELTIGTNHLGHFYLTNALLPLLEKNKSANGSNIVVTASGVHDPESPGGAQGSLATLGDLAGLEKAVSTSNQGGFFDMVDGGEYDADKAYKDSKLCNVFFTRELQRRLNEKGNTNINVNCFNPGLIVSTGLFRDQNPIFVKIFDFAATDLLKVGESIEFGGGALEYMTLDKSVNSKGGMYYTSPPGSSKYGDAAFGKQFALSEVSKEARDDAKAKRLWELSEKLVGISSA